MWWWWWCIQCTRGGDRVLSNVYVEIDRFLKELQTIGQSEKGERERERERNSKLLRVL
jgi:hypothetical protein